MNNIVTADYRFSTTMEKAKMKPDMQKIFGEYFQTGELCVLAGRTGVGKTILAYTIANGIARGERILGQPNEAGAQKLIYYDLELNAGHLKQRFANFEHNDNFLRPDMQEILTSDQDIDFSLNMIDKHIDETGAKVVILDNISALGMKTTQDPDTALKIMRGAMKLKNSKEISLLLLAHTPKLKESRPLELYDIAGSAHIHNFIDSAIMIAKSSKNPNMRYLKQVKNRNARETENVMIMSVNETNWLHFDYVNHEDEMQHLQPRTNYETNEIKREKLVSIARDIIGNRSMRYTEICNSYANRYSQTYENGKKIMRKLTSLNIVSQQSDKSYIISNDEESETFPAEEEPD